MKHKVFIGCIFFCFLACTRQYESTAPKDLISQKEIEEVLVDVYVLEAAVRTCTLSNQTDSLNLWTSQQMNAILKKYNISAISEYCIIIWDMKIKNYGECC